jgi:hypothetical protein
MRTVQPLAVLLEFPEFLDVFSSNLLKLFTKPEILISGGVFFGGNEDS